MDIKTFIQEYHPCPPAERYLLQQESLRLAWDYCESPTWLTWFFFWNGFASIKREIQFYLHLVKNFSDKCDIDSLESAKAGYKVYTDSNRKREDDYDFPDWHALHGAIDAFLLGLELTPFEICTIIRDFMGYPFGE